MKFFAHVSFGSRPRASHLVFLVSGLLWTGCVSLDQPAAVKACASSPQGCSDNPTRDAGMGDGAPPNPDVASQNDTPGAQVDLPPATPDLRTDADLVTELPVDSLVDSADGTVGLDVKDTTGEGIGDVSSWDLTSLDLPGLDLPRLDSFGPDLPGPDLPGPDLFGPDLPGLDLSEDLPTGRDSPTDIVPDLARDQVMNDGFAGNCITQIIADGYAAGTAPPCSECIENGSSLAAKCTGMLDCLAPPKTNADYTNCLNTVGGSSKVGDCVSALTTAGCPSGY